MRTARRAVCLDGLDDVTLLGVIGEAVGRLGEQPLSGAVGDNALLAGITELHILETRVHAEKLRRVREADARQVYLGKAMSTADLLAVRLGLTRAEGKTLTATALALADLPATAEKLARGELGVGQAQVAARALDELDRADAAAVAGPSGAAEAAAGTGPSLSAEAAAAENAADARRDLDALVAGQAPGEDRTGLRRRIDDWHARRGSDVLAERERRAHARRHASLGKDSGDPDDMSRLEARLTPLAAAHLRAALTPLLRPAGPDDTRTVGQRCHDALVTIATQALDAGALPQVAAQRPHVLLLTSADALHDTPDAAPSDLDGHGPVSADTARQICCDADITAVAVGRNGDVLDVGRADHTPTPAQRKAVIARDRHCVGCGAAATACQIHHIVYRSRGGPTIVDNLCLLCWSCHHNVHHNGWVVARRPDGRFTAHRPDASPALRHTA